MTHGEGGTPGALTNPHVAVVIPCYNVERHIEAVVRSLPSLVQTAVVVDDRSPDRFVEKVERLNDRRVVLLRHAVNQGVGGAMVTGYQECLRRGADIVVKMDGDGQMDPAYLPALIRPLVRAEADYTKGNRWFNPHELTTMPVVRRLGSVGLSFLTKLASGYWRLFDPCNGYTAIRASVLRQLPFDRLGRRFFFETSMLVQLNVLGAVVQDVPIPARYGDEKSTMSLRRVLREFPPALARACAARMWTRHFVRDFGPISICLFGGGLLTAWGVGFGAWKWAQSVVTGVPNTAGTVMLAAMPFLMGFQLLLQAALLEIAGEPTRPLCRRDGDTPPVADVYREAA